MNVELPVSGKLNKDLYLPLMAAKGQKSPN
jgi:hypothetical protein